MASKDPQGRSNWNLSEVVTIRGDRYCFGTFNDSVPSSTFVIFRIEPDSSLFPLTTDLGIDMSSCDVTNVKTIQEFIQRVRDIFIPRLNMWLKKKYPAGGTSTPSTGSAVVDMGNQVALMIKVSDGPSGVVATL